VTPWVFRTVPFFCPSRSEELCRQSQTIAESGISAQTTENAMEPIDPKALNVDCFLTRDATASALTAAGFPVKSKTLATKASRGGGPPYRRFGARPLYRWGDALEWAQSRLGPMQRNSSEVS